MIDRPAMAPPPRRRVKCRMARKSKPGRSLIAGATVCVAEPPDLCRVQRATRALCRSVGFDESDVYQAVIDVTERAYRLHLERARRVDIELSAHRRRDGLELRFAEAGAL